MLLLKLKFGDIGSPNASAMGGDQQQYQEYVVEDLFVLFASVE